MSTTAMRFGPEWMRKQPAPAKPLATSPPPPGASGGNSNGTTPTPPGAASYSALVTPHAPPVQGKRDIAHPFKYSRDEMLQVYRDLGGCSELPIEVERWEGVVRESAGEPVSLSDFTEMERKLHATSLNSEIRRRQSSDYVAQGDRSKGGNLSSGSGLMSRRRRGDSNGAEHPPLSLPRKTSWSGASGSLTSPSTTSLRARIGGNNGIDGILNGSDTAWGGGKRRAASGQLFTDRLDEEEEVHKEPAPSKTKGSVVSLGETSKESESRPHDKQESSATPPTVLQNSSNVIDTTPVPMSNLTLNTNIVNTQNTELVNKRGGDGTESTDFANVEWSYIDPSGTIQGPFPGEKMQLWHDQQYFTDELLMKRTNIDKEFAPLGEIKRRAQGGQTFLSPLVESLPPPGLGHPVPTSHVSSILQRTGIVDSPQSSPQSYGRGSTLDGFIGNGPGATISGSPSSSLGGSLARGPISPDPIPVGSRFQRFASDAALNGRVSAAGSYSSNGSPAMAPAVRQTFNEPSLPNRSSSFDAPPNVPWQVSQNNGWTGPPDVSHLGQPGRFEMASSFGHSQFIRDSSPYTVSSQPTSVNPYLPPSASSHRFHEQSDSLNPAFQQVSRDPSRFGFEGAPQQPPLPQPSTNFDHGFKQMSSPPIAGPIAGNASAFQHQAQTRHAPPPSPWEVPQERDIPRPRPFDVDIPTANNTFIVSSHQNTAWNRPQIETRPQVPWVPTPETTGQRQLMEQHQTLTTANVTQHNEQQKLLASRSSDAQRLAPTQVDASARAIADTPTTAATQDQPSTPVHEPPPQHPVPKTKATTDTTTTVPEKAQAANVTPTPKTPSAPPAPQRAPWGGDEEAKAKHQTRTNLRDIQEAEKKKQDARKHAEKERGRTARATSGASPSEEVQFTATWGLPTSQIGARSSTAPTAKEASTVSPANASSAPVWSNATKPARKTMKEIQEEEEKRKVGARERETAATAAKRAAQGPAVKVPAAGGPTSGGAWTVVGGGGKLQTAPSVATSRPAAVPLASTPNVQTVTFRPAVVHRTTSSPAVSKAVSSTAKANEEPTAPSLEFMKWMLDSLRGLNSSVQFEEIAQMLLSFPLDPDKATKEIIADTVYGASTTLNGRDFAEEFVKKRKEDVLARSKSPSGRSTNGKPTSLADVVKAQPKQPQNDFGAFKVVKKKNKRS